MVGPHLVHRGTQPVRAERAGADDPAEAEFGHPLRVHLVLGRRRHQDHGGPRGQGAGDAAEPGVRDEDLGMAQHGQLGRPGVHLDVGRQGGEVGGVDALVHRHDDVPRGVTERLDTHPEELRVPVDAGAQRDQDDGAAVGGRGPLLGRRRAVEAGADEAVAGGVERGPGRLEGAGVEDDVEVLLAADELLHGGVALAVLGEEVVQFTQEVLEGGVTGACPAHLLDQLVQQLEVLVGGERREGLGGGHVPGAGEDAGHVVERQVVDDQVGAALPQVLLQGAQGALALLEIEGGHPGGVVGGDHLGEVDLVEDGGVAEDGGAGGGDPVHEVAAGDVGDLVASSYQLGGDVEGGDHVAEAGVVEEDDVAARPVGAGRAGVRGVGHVSGTVAPRRPGRHGRPGRRRRPSTPGASPSRPG